MEVSWSTLPISMRVPVSQSLGIQDSPGVQDNPKLAMAWVTGE